MVRRIGLFLIPVVFVTAPGIAQEEKPATDEGKVQPSGKWKMVYDYKIDGALKEQEGAFAHLRLDIKGTQVIGKFEEPRLKDSECIFAGEFIAGKEGTLLMLRQTGHGRPAVYVGRLTGKNRFAGTWLEARAGSEGEFELTFVEK